MIRIGSRIYDPDVQGVRKKTVSKMIKVVNNEEKRRFIRRTGTR